jgi:hypothetical protein
MDDFFANVEDAPGTRIGQPVWYVGTRANRGGMHEPTISQTWVNELRKDGRVGVVHRGDGELHLAAEGAAAAWRAEAERLLAVYRSWADNMEKRLAETDAEALRGMVAASLADGARDNSLAAALDDDPPAFRPDGYPEPRFRPGQTVWGVCDEGARTVFGDRPEAAFTIVETRVESVSAARWAKTPTLDYRFDCAYRVSDDMVFATREEAEAKREEVIAARIAALEALRRGPAPVVAYSRDDAIRESAEQMFGAAGKGG